LIKIGGKSDQHDDVTQMGFCGLFILQYILKKKKKKMSKIFVRIVVVVVVVDRLLSVMVVDV